MISRSDVRRGAGIRLFNSDSRDCLSVPKAAGFASLWGGRWEKDETGGRRRAEGRFREERVCGKLGLKNGD